MSAEGMSRGSTARALSAVREDRGEVQRRLDRLRAELVEMETEVLALSQLLATVAIDPERPLRDPASKRVDGAEDVEYLSIRDLARRIPYAEQTIRNLMTGGVFRLGEHYIKPRSRIMFRWSKVRDWLDRQNNSV